MNQSILNDVLDLINTYENSLPTDATQIAAAAIQATTLMNDCFDANLRGDFPPPVLKLLTLQGRLSALAEANARRAQSQQKQLRAYTRSERLAITGLQRAVATLEQQLSVASPQAKARIAAALEVTRGELKDRIELRITTRHRRQELQRDVTSLEQKLALTENPTSKAFLENQLNSLRQEVSKS